MSTEPLDLGSGITATWFVWSPDRDLNPQYDGIPDIDPAGVILNHPDARDPSKRCKAAVTFDLPGSDVLGEPRWQVQSLDPLTISPSVLCVEGKGGCGLHGFIRESRWVAA